jgi:hypothetical protein
VHHSQTEGSIELTESVMSLSLLLLRLRLSLMHASWADLARTGPWPPSATRHPSPPHRPSPETYSGAPFCSA